MNPSLIRFLFSRCFYRYLITIPFSYLNALIPAALMAAGGWIVEHGMTTGEILLVVLTFFFLYVSMLFWGKRFCSIRKC